jgi:hypothetical protein
MDIGGKHTDRKKRYKIVALLGGSFYLECDSALVKPYVYSVGFYLWLCFKEHLV